MKIRILLVKFFLRLSRFLSDTPVLILNPNQIIEYQKINYRKKNIIRSWCDPKVLELGLSDEEKKGIDDIPFKEGSLLLLGVGGGREAIPLAKMGFQVTGVDFVEEMVQNAVKNAQKHGVEIKGKVFDISNPHLSKDCYDIVWMSASLYSCIPSRKKRIRMLKSLNKALKPGGYLFGSFQFDFNQEFSPIEEKLKQITAFLSLGNLHYEKGDIFFTSYEFIHRFVSQDSLVSEFEEGGFEVLKINFPTNDIKGYALLKAEEIEKNRFEKCPDEKP
ncbi:MAG: class I SAM-dependent methyltransferase [Candidatus Aminicenantes bacterium]